MHPNEVSAERAVADARERLKADYGDLVYSVFHYGAVGLNTRHLVVWVILSLPPEALPPWLFFPEPPAGASLTPELRAKLNDMQTTVRTSLVKRNWPEADLAKVGFESDERLRAGGGWAYFK